MTHVLLEKNLNSGKDIRCRLGQWGMTVGEFDPLQPNFQWPTILECDLAIMESGTVSSMDQSLSSSDSDSLAPIILLGVSGFLLLARDAWQVLPESNPNSKSLNMAVTACLEQGALLRHGLTEGPDREDFLSFLGHEMRSPLTAAKTALEVLQGDLGGIGSPDGSADPQLKMLEIALRNVRRLHHTVEWSQELMAASPLEKNIRLLDMDVVDLQNNLGKFQSANWEESTLHMSVYTDGDSLAMLLDQVARALHYAMPEGQLKFHAQSSSENLGALSLTLSLARGSVQDGAPRISRLGLTSSSMEGDSAAAELERLVRFVISPMLISRLGVTLEVLDTGDDELGIRILVPAAMAAGTEGQSVGQLLTPA